MMMMMKMVKMMDWIAWIASIMTMVMVMKGLQEGCEKMAKASQGVGATRLAKEMPASALNQRWFAILDAMEGL